MEQNNLPLTLESTAGSEALTFPARRLICAGWVGRDRDALQAHIDELAEHGVPGPSRIPIYMNFSLNLISLSDIVDVVSDESSGEIEYVILKQGDRIFVGVGSDHTDRGFEKYSIPASKQMYPKVMAQTVWPYEELKDHWDQIMLRAWAVEGGKRILYQEDALSSILGPDRLLSQVPGADAEPIDSCVLFSGTIATKAGLIFAERFEFEMEDPVLKRTLEHGYTVRRLMQYL